MSARQDELVKTAEVLGESPRFPFAVFAFCESDAEVAPGVLKAPGGHEVDVRDDVTKPARNMQDILEKHLLGLSAPRLAADLELNRADAFDRDLALIGDG